MNIEFKIGEHYYEPESFWVNLFIAIFGTFIGFIFALYIDRKVAKRNKISTIKEEIRRKVNVLNYLNYIIKGVLTHIPRQIEKYQEYGKVLDQKPLENEYPEVIVTFDLLRLRNLDNLNTQNAYLSLFTDKTDSFDSYKTIFATGDYIFQEFESLTFQTEKTIMFKRKDHLFIKRKLDELSFLLMVSQNFIKN
jgi:hypothetical protein